MGLKTTATMSVGGRLTVPKAAREALHLEGRSRLEIEVTDDALVLRPTVSTPDEDEDAWARTPEFRQAIQEARKDAEEGRVWQLNSAQLDGLIELADERQREGLDRRITVDEIHQFLIEHSE